MSNVVHVWVKFEAMGFVVIRYSYDSHLRKLIYHKDPIYK